MLVLMGGDRYFGSVPIGDGIILGRPPSSLSANTRFSPGTPPNAAPAQHGRLTRRGPRRAWGPGRSRVPDGGTANPHRPVSAGASRRSWSRGRGLTRYSPSPVST